MITVAIIAVMIVAIAQVMTLVIVIIATVATVITQTIIIHKMQVLMHINIKKSTIWSALHFRFERRTKST